eukprot:gb/GECG01006350.1/.p1 GENE.gb/GECG01006350.1/~~gb/GECG01006350.1/.p1  ORF type:complete len:613 (+),score=66.54 gb/GECG01006350.1/:1-1839(+)
MEPLEYGSYCTVSILNLAHTLLFTMGQGQSSPTGNAPSQEADQPSSTHKVRQADYSYFLRTAEGYEAHIIEFDPTEWPDIKDEVLDYLTSLQGSNTVLGVAHVSPASLAIQGVSRLFLNQDELHTNIQMIETAGISDAYVDTSKLGRFRSVVYRLLPKLQLTHQTLATQVFGTNLFAAALAGIRPHDHLTSVLGTAKAYQIPVALVDVEFHQRNNLLEQLNSKLECFALNEAIPTLTENVEICTSMIDWSIHAFVKTMCNDTSVEKRKTTFALEESEDAADVVQKVFERSSAEASRIKHAQAVIRNSVKNANVDMLRRRPEGADYRTRRALETAAYMKWQPIHNLRKYGGSLLFMERDPVHDRYVARRLRALAHIHQGAVVTILPRQRSQGIQRVWGDVSSEQLPSEQAVRKSIVDGVVKWGDVEVGGTGNANVLHQILSTLDAPAGQSDSEEDTVVTVQHDGLLPEKWGEVGSEKKFNCLIEPFNEESKTWGISSSTILGYGAPTDSRSPSLDGIYREWQSDKDPNFIAREQQKHIVRAQQAAMRRSITVDAALLSTSAYLVLRVSRHSPGAASGMLVGLGGLTAALGGGLAINVARYTDMVDQMARRTMS